jgi:hypothetical protein
MRPMAMRPASGAHLQTASIEAGVGGAADPTPQVPVARSLTRVRISAPEKMANGTERPGSFALAAALRAQVASSSGCHNRSCSVCSRPSRPRAIAAVIKR